MSALRMNGRGSAHMRAQLCVRLEVHTQHFDSINETVRGLQ